MKSRVYFSFDPPEGADVDDAILDLDREFTSVIRLGDVYINLVCSNAKKIDNNYYIDVESLEVLNYRIGRE